jgi:hypothetical protein
MMDSYFCQVLRPASGGDCTNKGESSRYANAELFRMAPDAETVEALHKRNIGAFLLSPPKLEGSPMIAKALQPGWSMAGGNFLWSCDSRFRQEVSPSPISIHDRFE